MNIREYQLLWFCRKVKRKLTGKSLIYTKYAGKDLMELQATNDWMAEKISDGQPFMAGRFGSVELGATWVFDLPGGPSSKTRERIAAEMRNNAGFFPEKPDMVEKYARLLEHSCQEVDLLGVWFNPMEDYLAERYAPQCRLTHLTALEPWYVERPWTRVLKEKKVVVIHPFTETIKKQYEKRTELFDDPDILPEFEKLYTVKAVQTIAGCQDARFATWFEALEWMYEEAMKTDFDVAIIGCGAYGFPLAARIKAAGRQAIHMGGATQLLFGIKGRRWDEYPLISRLYKESWVRPDEKEKPMQAEKVEEGCYW